MKKRLLAALMAVSMCFVLCACGGEPEVVLDDPVPSNTLDGLPGTEGGDNPVRSDEPADGQDDMSSLPDGVEVPRDPEDVLSELDGAGDGQGDVDAGNGSVLEDGVDYIAVLNIKDYGGIRFKLRPDVAPVTVENFIKLADGGFYDGLTFHRIIKDFMIQGGDPMGNGMGGARDEIYGEFASNGWESNTLSHVRGTVSMARSSDPDSASSQFFIVHGDATYLDGDYAAFGTVESGMEVVDAICDACQPIDGNGGMLPDEQPVIESLIIERVPVES